MKKPLLIRIMAFAVLIISFPMVSCNVGDDSAPSRITDLSFDVNSRLLSWTAPGDDGNSGRATVYDLRFFDDSEIAAFLGLSSLDGVPFDIISQTVLDNFGEATQIQGEPLPEQAGTLQNFLVDRLDIKGSKRFFMALNTRDEVGSNAGPSNVVEVETSLASVEFRTTAEPSCFGDTVAGGDFNNDGLNDVVIGDPCAGKVYVYYGRNDLPNTDKTGDGIVDADGADSADTVIIGNASEGFGYSVSSAESFTGDASKEILIGAPFFDGSRGRLYIIEGSRDRLPSVVNLSTGEAQPRITVDGENPGDLFGFSVTGALGVEGRTRRGILIGAPGFASSKGRVYLLRSEDLEDSGSATQARAFIDGAIAGERLGESVSLVGEVNTEDAFKDFAAGAPGSGRIYVFFGEDGFTSIDLGADTSKVTILSGDPALGWGTAFAGGGIIRGFFDPDDPKLSPSDILVGVPGDGLGAGSVLLFSGSDVVAARGTGLNPPVSVQYVGESPGDNFGASLAVLEDVNPQLERLEQTEGIILGLRKTNPDFVVGAPGNANGKAYVFFGAESISSLVSALDADVTIDSHGVGSEFGRLVVSLGDITGDRISDFAVSAIKAVSAGF